MAGQQIHGFVAQERVVAAGLTHKGFPHAGFERQGVDEDLADRLKSTMIDRIYPAPAVIIVEMLMVLYSADGWMCQVPRDVSVRPGALRTRPARLRLSD
jgi:hypothetical protein